MNILTEEVIRKIKEYAFNGAEFKFTPSTELCDMIAKDIPIVRGIAKTFKELILMKLPIRVDTEMILKFCDKTLDDKNSFILHHGDINIIPRREKINILKKGENK